MKLTFKTIVAVSLFELATAFAGAFLALALTGNI